jgi:hypothetical protein
MVRQVQAVRRVAHVMTDQSATHARRATTDTPVDRVPRVTTVRFAMTAVPVPLVMTALLARTARTVPLVTNTLSAMVAPFAKAATWMPRASLTVPFEPPGMNDVTYAPRVMTVRFAMIDRLVTTGLQVDRDPRATTVHRARIAAIVHSAQLVMTVRHVTTVAQHAMTAALETIVSRVTTDRLVTTVPPAATRISILRATRRRSTSPAKTSYSSVFRQWPLRPMTSMA